MELQKGYSTITTTTTPLLLALMKTYNPQQATTHNHHITWTNNNSNYNNNNKMIMKKYKYNQKINSLVMIKLITLRHVILIGKFLLMMMMIWKMLRSILCLIFD